MSAIKSKLGGEEAPPPPSPANYLYGFVSSLKFAILLLSLIAVGSILGTVVKQQASPEEYLSFYSQSTYTLIRFFGLNDIFHARWFLSLITLFALNLVLCTTQRFFGMMRRGKKDLTIPDENALSAMGNSFFAKGRTVDDVSACLRGFKQEEAKGEGTLLEKGAISRYGVYMIHLSIIVILVGSLIGLVFGYRGPLTLHSGETRDSVQVRGGAGRMVPLGFTLKCNDFKASFYPNGQPKDYVSFVEILEGGKKVLEKEIRVNSPLSYRGINFYQATYGSTPVFLFDIGGEQVSLTQETPYSKDGLFLMPMRFEKSVHNFGAGVQIGYVEDEKPAAAWFLKDVPRLRERDIKGVKVRLLDIKDQYYTGLEVSRDPGVWVVWSGFILILLGLYVNFFLYRRRIYLLQKQEGTLVAGMAFKNREAFKAEFEKIKEKIDVLER
jgi:cytochrome c biogenesis protein